MHALRQNNVIKFPKNCILRDQLRDYLIPLMDAKNKAKLCKKTKTLTSLFRSTAHYNRMQYVKRDGRTRFSLTNRQYSPSYAAHLTE